MPSKAGACRFGRLPSQRYVRGRIFPVPPGHLKFVHAWITAENVHHLLTENGFDRAHSIAASWSPIKNDRETSTENSLSALRIIPGSGFRSGGLLDIGKLRHPGGKGSNKRR
jgi:hypothetical protein